MRAGRGAALVAFVVGLLVTASDVPTREVVCGVSLVAANYQKPPPSETLAGAWDQAWRLAQSNRDAFGYPWLDARTGQLVLTAANAAGEDLGRAWAAAGRVPVRVERATRSVAQLQRIQDESIGPAVADLPDADAIYMNGPDFDHNRIVITVDRLSPRLLCALAARYGTEAIAIHVDPRRPIFSY